MKLEEYRTCIRNFFEQYYEKLSQDDCNIELPLDENNRMMWAEDADPDKEWKRWKLVPANIDENEIADFEQQIGVELPLIMKVFLTTYHHFFENPIGRNPVSQHFEGMKNAWNPLLVKYGYLPFAWDKEHYFIRCMQLANMPTEEKCGIYQIDHEVLFRFDEESVTQEEIDENMKFISENLLTYLDEILYADDEDSEYRALMKDVLTILRDDFGVEDLETLEMKMAEDSNSIYNALQALVEEYDLSEEDVEEILKDAQYLL